MASRGGTARKHMKKAKLQNTSVTSTQKLLNPVIFDADSMLLGAQQEGDLNDKNVDEQAERHQRQNCLVIQGPISSFKEIQPYTGNQPSDPTNFEVCTVPSTSKRFLSNPKCLVNMLLLVALVLCIVRPAILTERMLGFVVLSLLTYVLYHVVVKRNTSSLVRVITWRLDEFSSKLKTGFLSSPEFNASTCRWIYSDLVAHAQVSLPLLSRRLVIRQKHFPRGIQTSFGIIATNIPSNLDSIEVKINFSVTNSEGQDLVLDVGKLNFNGTFESEGDCGYSANVLLTADQLIDDNLQIKCRAAFTPAKVGLLKQLSINEQNEARNKGPRKVVEVGFIHPEVCDSEPCGHLNCSFGLMAFIQNPDTKTFIWKIPSFKSEIQSTECWGIYSPHLVVNSHGVCSIWRLKLVELHGSFRIHMQVRGLPRAVSQVTVSYTVELMDNFGDYVFPEGCFAKVQYPDYLSIWGTTRMPLYSRQALMTRFFANETGLTLRVSINVEPVENSSFPCLRGSNSCEWIVARQN